MIIEIEDRHISELQVANIRRLLNDATGMSMADVNMRINGENRYFEADWLRHAKIKESTND